MTYYEMKKVFARRSSRIGLLLMGIVLAVVLYFIISENTYVNENGDTEQGLGAIAKVRELKREWAGELTEDRIRQVIQENGRISRTPEALSQDPRENDKAFGQKQGFLDIRSLLACSYSGFSSYDYYLPDSLSGEDAANFYSNRINNLKEWLDTEAKDQFSQKEKDYLIRSYESLQTPLYYDYQEGWISLLEYAPTIIMLSTLIMSFFCAGIFSGEFQQKSSAVFYSSRYGRDRAVAAKMKAALILITVCYWGIMLLYTGMVLGLLGADGGGCPIQSSSSGWKSIYSLTYWQEYLLVIFGGYLGCLFMLLLSMWVSARTNSAVLAVTVPFVLIFLPSFLSGFPSPFMNKVLGLLPDQLLQMNRVTGYFNLYEMGGKIITAIPLLLALYTVLCLLLLPAIYNTYRKKQVY